MIFESGFIPEVDMNAIDGVIADLSARTDRPQGYPFSKITVYSVCPEVKQFMPKFKHVPASDVPSMKRLDFKKAGKDFGSKVQEMKNDLSKVPEEYLIIANRFDMVNEPTRKTTGCRKHLIEVECKDQEKRWLAIQFRKAVKKYITEDLNINIVPPIFGDKYPDLNESYVPRVWVILGNCREDLYQALEKYGEEEFSQYPIRLRIPTRQWVYDNIDEYNHSVDYGAGEASFMVIK